MQLVNWVSVTVKRLGKHSFDDPMTIAPPPTATRDWDDDEENDVFAAMVALESCKKKQQQSQASPAFRPFNALHFQHTTPSKSIKPATPVAHACRAIDPPPARPRDEQPTNVDRRTVRSDDLASCSAAPFASLVTLTNVTLLSLMLKPAPRKKPLAQPVTTRLTSDSSCTPQPCTGGSESTESLVVQTSVPP